MHEDPAAEDGIQSNVFTMIKRSNQIQPQIIEPPNEVQYEAGDEMDADIYEHKAAETQRSLLGNQSQLSIP